MQAHQIRSVVVVGAGTMGHGIAQDFAAHGYTVKLFARSQPRLDQALLNIQDGLALLKRLGQLSAEQVGEVLSRIHGCTELEDATQDADFVVEAVSEDLGVK